MFLPNFFYLCDLSLIGPGDADELFYLLNSSCILSNFAALLFCFCFSFAYAEESGGAGAGYEIKPFEVECGTNKFIIAFTALLLLLTTNLLTFGGADTFFS